HDRLAHLSWLQHRPPLADMGVLRNATLPQPMPRSNSANSGIARCDARIDPLQNVCVAKSGSGSIFSGPHAAESQAMTESRQSRYALERAQPVRYIVTAETLQHFQHLDCPAGPGYWSIGDGDASRAYYCPYCGVRLAPEVTA
ncbi:MAG: hypothetical protein WAU60_06890, partial [Candidatus Competibacter denitrificans]